MNQEFIVKMIQAKKMEYDAVMELVPEKVKQKISKAGEEAVSIIFEYIKRINFNTECGSNNNQNMNGDGYESAHNKKYSDNNFDYKDSKKNNTNDLKKVRKINIQ